MVSIFFTLNRELLFFVNVKWLCMQIMKVNIFVLFLCFIFFLTKKSSYTKVLKALIFGACVFMIYSSFVICFYPIIISNVC